MTETELIDEKALFKLLIELGCCKRCALRFISNTDNDFHDIEVVTKKFTGSDQIDDENVVKKPKLNPCVICLDLLQDATIESMVANLPLEKLLEYDCETFTNFISFPTAVLIREHSVKVYLKDKFPEHFKDHCPLAINKAWSLSIQNKLATKLHKTFDKNSYLQIQFNVTYEFDTEESSVMNNFKEKKSRSQNNVNVSRNVVTESLSTIKDSLFREHAPVPPQTPTKSLVLDQITYKHDHIFVAGRYCKYSRNLFQTPWSSDDAEETTFSVQEIIFQALDDIFKCGGMIFSSSGREDFDVRMLGRGRPFFIKVVDPKVTKIPFLKFREIEKRAKKTKILTIKDLQIIDRKCINQIKDGEQFKQKTYNALCIVDKPENLSSYIEKINKTSKLTLIQKTPLRVFHRRSADDRTREIYEMSAKPVPGRNNLFELELVTQAGTYVKEFVHGDLGRTSPSLSELVGGYVDILALDVLDIHLDFPPSLHAQTRLYKELGIPYD